MSNALRVAEFKSTCLYRPHFKAILISIAEFAFVNCPHHVDTVLFVYKAADKRLDLDFYRTRHAQRTPSNYWSAESRLEKTLKYTPCTNF